MSQTVGNGSRQVWPDSHTSEIPNHASGCLKGCLIIFMIPFILPVFIGIAVIFTNIGNEKISTDKYDAGTFIEDNAGVLGDTSELENAMDDFLDKSGVSAAVVTIDNRVWQEGRSYTNNPDLYLNGPYTDIEQYASDLYNDMFDDEYHILVVYSTNTEIIDSENWYYELIAGSKIDSSIPDSDIEEFDVNLYANLLNVTQNPSDALTDSFYTFTDDLSYVKFPLSLKLLIAGFCFFFAFSAIFIIVKIIKFTNSRKGDAAGNMVFPQSSPYGVDSSADSIPPYGSGASSAAPPAAPPAPYKDDDAFKASETISTDKTQSSSAHTYDKSYYEEDDAKVDGLFSGLFKKRDDDGE